MDDRIEPTLEPLADTTPPPSPRWGLGDAIAGLVLQIVLSSIAALLLVRFDVSEAMFFVLLQLAGWIAAIGWAARATYLKGSRSFRTDFGLRWERFDVFRGIAAGFGTLILIAIVVAALGADVGDPTISELEPDGAFQVLLFGLALVAGAPIVEEIFFRGLFLRAAERRFGRFGGVVFVTTVFTVLHVPQRMELGFVLAFVPIFTIGLLFALLAVRYRRLGPSIAAHMTFNGIAFLALMASQNAGT